MTHSTTSLTNSRNDTPTLLAQKQALHAETSKPWLRRKGETLTNFAKFTTYRQIPQATRTVTAAYKIWTANQEALGKKSKRKNPNRIQTPPIWYDLARDFDWESRADAWDAYQEQIILLSEKQDILAERRLRREMITDKLQKINKALDRAEIEEMEPDDLRRYMDTLLRAFNTLIAASRTEAGEATEIIKQENVHSGTINITADMMAKAVQELETAGLPIITKPVSG